MTQFLLLIYVILNSFTQATEKITFDEERSHKVITKILQNIYTAAEKNLKLPDECMICYEIFSCSVNSTPMWS